MKLLLQKVKIFDSNSPHHLKTMDVLIESGSITKIAKDISVAKEYKVFSKEQLCISPVWLETNMHIFEPGLEYREDFKSGLTAAAQAGFGNVCLMPNTNPPVDTNSQVSFVKNSSQKYLCQALPLGAVSKGIEGVDLAEIYDMQSGGALAFTDGNKAILNAGLMERALWYVKKFDGLVISNPDNLDLSHGSQMNEGVNSTLLGMQGAPKLAEEIMVARDLFLLEHTQSRLHFNNISTKKSVALIKEAKAKGLQVTASVNIYNLLFDDKELLDFDTNFKVKPHLRNKEDVKALLNGLKNGTIDLISSGHLPLHEDEKKVEFENAEFGMSTIDSFFGAARKATAGVLSEEQLLEKFENAHKIMGVEPATIVEGEKAHLTVFDTDSSYTFEKKDLLSKGKNNPFVGVELKGRVYGIIQASKTNIL